MSGTGFEHFAEAISTQSRNSASSMKRSFQRITILGGGADALLIAALCLAEGADITLFSAYGAELDSMRKHGSVALRGVGPIGNYQFDREDSPSIRTTAELDRAVADAEVIFLTGPIHKQRTYAMVLADHVRDGQVLVLAPGRSLGAAEAAWLLRVGGANADYTLVETQGLPYWFEANGNTLTLSEAASVSAATLPAGRNDIIEALQQFLPNIEATHSTLFSGFIDGSGLVEVPALLMGGPAIGDGLPVIPDGGVALEENNCFRALIGAEHISVIDQLANERRKVAAKFGVRNLPTTDKWLDIHAGSLKKPAQRPLPSRTEAVKIVRCATIGSLASLSSAAKTAGCPVPVTDAMITLASSVLGADIASAGRKLESIGINAEGIEDARRILDNIAQGAR